jgi:hypothetical protein
LSARIVILDLEGAPVPGAQVTVEWTWPDGSTSVQQATTDANGAVRFQERSSREGSHEICVTNASRTGWIYAPQFNIETCETLSVP